MNSYSLIPWSLLSVSRKPPPNLFREEILHFIQRDHQPLIFLVSSLLNYFVALSESMLQIPARHLQDYMAFAS